MKYQNRVKSLRLLLALLALFMAMGVSFAQSAAPTSSPQPSPKPANAPQQSPSPEASPTRVRRVSSDSPEEAPPGSESKAPPEAADKTAIPENKTPEAKTQEARSPSTKTPGSDVAAMRDEIEAETNEPERLRLQLKLVEYLVSVGKKQEAIAELNLMSGVDRFNPQGFYNIANAQARLGDSQGAIVTYRKAIDQRKGRYSRALNNLGVVLLRLGRWDEAYDALLSALRLESFRYAEASYNLGRLYAARGEYDRATREWQRALTVDPEHSLAANALARSGSTGSIRVARAAVGRPVDTARLSEKEKGASTAGSPKPKGSSQTTFTVDADSYAFLQRARGARDRNRNEEAVDNYRRVIGRMGGYFAPANLELAFALISLRRNDEATATLLPLVAKDGHRLPIAFYHLARLYEQKGDLTLAEENFKQAADSYGDGNAQFLLDLSRVREKLGNLTGALASLEQYVTSMERLGQKPDWSDARLAALREKAAAPTTPKP